jgi:hypothetical protein
MPEADAARAFALADVRAGLPRTPHTLSRIVARGCLLLTTNYIASYTCTIYMASGQEAIEST